MQMMNLKRNLIPFKSIVRVMQMKLMKVIDKMQNMMIQEVHHSVGFQLIEAIKIKMLLIQFQPIVDFIQRKLTKVIYNVNNMHVHRPMVSG
jgi:hypothetical protein